MGGDAVELGDHDAEDLGPLRDVVGDTQQLLDSQAVRQLIEEVRDVVASRHEGHTLGPGAELHVLLDTGVEESDTDAKVGHRLTIELDDESHDAVGGRVGRSEVHDDGLVAPLGSLVDDLGPVAALGQVLVVLAHQL